MHKEHVPPYRFISGIFNSDHYRPDPTPIDKSLTISDVGAVYFREQSVSVEYELGVGRMVLQYMTGAVVVSNSRWTNTFHC